MRLGKERMGWRKCSNRDFNGQASVDAMLIIKIDAVNLQPPQAALACCSYMPRLPAHFALAIRKTYPKFSTHFSSASHPSLQSLQPIILASSIKTPAKNKNQASINNREKKDLAQKGFVGEGAIAVGGVEKCDAGIDGLVNEFDHLGLGLGRAVEGGHAHTT